MTLIVKRIVRLLTNQDDIIYLDLEAPSPFPELDAKEPGKYPATAQVRVRYNFGEEWTIKAFGRKPDELIDGRKAIHQYSRGRI